MALSLWLCLLAPALQVTSQESCHPEGSLPAPQLSLNVSLAHAGDTVTFRCLVPGESPMTRVIFCEDGQEAASQPITPGRFSYDFTHRVSGPGDAGDFSCWYQHRGDNNELVNSNLSTPKTLSVTAWDLYLILGILVPCALLLGLLGLLGVASSRRRPREPGPSGGEAGVSDPYGGYGGGGDTEEQLHYAAPQERGRGDIRGAEDVEGTSHARGAPGLMGAEADAGGQRGRWLGTGTTLEPGSWLEASGAAGIPRKASLSLCSPLKQGVFLARPPASGLGSEHCSATPGAEQAPALLPLGAGGSWLGVTHSQVHPTASPASVPSHGPSSLRARHFGPSRVATAGVAGLIKQAASCCNDQTSQAQGATSLHPSVCVWGLSSLPAAQRPLLSPVLLPAENETNF
ncbi:uncharacterized protein LOC123350572 [Mauremys mutica]|uniref:uncharacterized protein LOC123350572 n=1 Tax=Mauremys mutica TaxID=74926 RepID=UPI001D16A8C8|nr:uncharacterized protein LOC123350572 [Mauremys mutica]